VRKVVFIDSVHEILWQRLEKRGFQCIHAIEWPEEKIKEAIKEAFGLVILARFQLYETFLKDCTKLQFISRSDSRLENIDTSYCE
jgi:phosphoglycerate dehydrogenase-like enzyme